MKLANEGEKAANELLATKEQGFQLLLTVTDFFVRCCLDEVCLYRYKPQLSTTVHKLVLVFQKVAVVQEKPYEQCLQSIYTKIMASLSKMDKKETLTGAINLLEVFLSVLDQQRFEQGFA